MHTHYAFAFTRDCFTSSRLCTSPSSFPSSGAPALRTLLQYARLLGNIRPLLELPLVCYTPYNCGNNNIV